MPNPTRFNRIGLSGARSPDHLTDAFIQIIDVPLPLVASTDEQFTGVFLPARSWVFTGFLNILESAIGGTPTISVGEAAASSTSFLNQVQANDPVGFASNITNQFQHGVEITYTLGSDDWTAWQGEMLLYVVASREPI